MGFFFSLVVFYGFCLFGVGGVCVCFWFCCFFFPLVPGFGWIPNTDHEFNWHVSSGIMELCFLSRACSNLKMVLKNIEKNTSGKISLFDI